MMLYILFFLVAILVAALLAWLYLLPGRIALNKNYPRTGLLMTINIALGWTLLGWLAVFIWSLFVPRSIIEPAQ